MPNDARPPKAWWDKMYKEISDSNPSYSEDQVKRTIGDIWYHELSDAKRKQIRHRRSVLQDAISQIKNRRSSMSRRTAGVGKETWDKFEHLVELMGDKGVLEELMRAMSDLEMLSCVDWIIQQHGLSDEFKDFEGYETEEVEEDEDEDEDWDEEVEEE